MFEAYCTRQVSLAAVNQIYVIQLQKSKDSLKACFENVNMKMGLKWIHMKQLVSYNKRLETTAKFQWVKLWCQFAAFRLVQVLQKVLNS